MNSSERIIKKLQTSSGAIPFDDWILSLRDKKTRAIIAARLLRIQAGNLGDVKSVGSGVFEFRIQYGPGFRIYFADVEGQVIILLGGGDKSSQRKDVRRAIQLWTEYKDEVNRYYRDL
ncbi:MAG: type II toxin-antitoxin system RelE/ParE family toxin [Cyanobacteria bacterium P01_E01_bin.6]